MFWVTWSKPGIRHQSELTARDWENVAQRLDKNPSTERPGRWLHSWTAMSDSKHVWCLSAKPPLTSVFFQQTYDANVTQVFPWRLLTWPFIAQNNRKTYAVVMTQRVTGAICITWPRYLTHPRGFLGLANGALTSKWVSSTVRVRTGHGLEFSLQQVTWQVFSSTLQHSRVTIHTLLRMLNVKYSHFSSNSPSPLLIVFALTWSSARLVTTSLPI